MRTRCKVSVIVRPLPMKNGCCNPGICMSSLRFSALVKSLYGEGEPLGWFALRKTPTSELSGAFNSAIEFSVSCSASVPPSGSVVPGPIGPLCVPPMTSNVTSCPGVTVIGASVGAAVVRSSVLRAVAVVPLLRATHSRFQDSERHHEVSTVSSTLEQQ